MRSFLFVLLFIPSLSFAATSITMYNGECGEISWTFDGDYTVGYFVDGQPYVVAPSGLTVNSVSPNPTTSRNISRVNPPINSTMGFDARVRNTIDTTIALTTPISLSPEDSLVSTVSVAEGAETTSLDTCGPYWGTTSTSIGKSRVRSSAILTVVASAPPANSFRPPYFGTNNKVPQFTTADVDSSWLLNLPVDIGKRDDLSFLERSFERPWTSIHVSDYIARDNSPHQNMYSYHRELGDITGRAALQLLAEASGSKTQLLYSLIQNGLDYYHMFKSGLLGTSSAYKTTTLIAGLALQNDTILNVFKSGQVFTSVSFGYPRDVDKFYYWADRKNNESTGSGVVEGQTWTGSNVFFTKEWEEPYEHLMPVDWPASACSDEGYRQIDTKEQIGTILFAQLAGLKDEWSHDAAFDYMDRYMNENMSVDGRCTAIAAACGSCDPTDYQITTSNFVNYMYATHRGYVPPTQPTLTPLRLIFNGSLIAH